MSLSELKSKNPQLKSDTIYVGDKLNLDYKYRTEDVDIRAERQRERELNKDNVSAIQGYRHTNNYVIIDKKNRKLNVYDKNNNLLYSTSNFATGASGDDYNTATYTDENGKLIDGAGNNSTPAGMLQITGVGSYHGYPSFIRSRLDSEGNVRKVPERKKDEEGKWYKTGRMVDDNIASSLHWGNIGTERKVSNGCIRVGGKDLCNINQFIGEGSRIYTLPEQEGSRFTLRGGRLNFTADKPYGNDDPENDKRFWDDYNVNIDKSYSPLKIKYAKTGNKEYDDNVKQFTQTIVNSKRTIQKDFNLSSDEYNRLAELALGIAEQESKFGTGTSWDPRHNYKLKALMPNVVDVLNGASGTSRGLTQIKITDDGEDYQKLYEKYGIDKNNIYQVDKSSLATIIRLAHMYNNEVKAGKFVGADGNILDPYHVLLYKWNGKHKELKNKTATPDKNKYIRHVNEYSRRFKMYEKRKYRQ